MLYMEKTILNGKTREEWKNLIFEHIHNERDRWLLERRLLDGVYLDELTLEYQRRYPDRSLEYDQIRRRVKSAEKQLINSL